MPCTPYVGLHRSKSKTLFEQAGLGVSKGVEWHSVLQSRLVVGQRTLNPLTEVRILPLQPEARSSNGRTRAFEAHDGGSNPPLAA